jgi:hypothetical protein
LNQYFWKRVALTFKENITSNIFFKMFHQHFLKLLMNIFQKYSNICLENKFNILPTNLPWPAAVPAPAASHVRGARRSLQSRGLPCGGPAQARNKQAAPKEPRRPTAGEAAEAHGGRCGDAAATRRLQLGGGCGKASLAVHQGAVWQRHEGRKKDEGGRRKYVLGF